MDDFHKQKTIPGIIGDESTLPIQIPQQIGPYKIDSLLERGGMSLLYLSTLPDTQEPIVIKVLEPKFLSRQDIVQRFLAESKMIGLPEHPNIVKLFGQGEWEGGFYIAMEYIQGISLRQYLLKTPISVKKALEIVIEISYALCHLHTHGIIHRDLKPENVIITKEGQIKVIDFGIAQLLTEQPDPRAPAKQLIIGTPVYMSPEQRENPDTVAYPSDIYSLGIIAYELVLGKLSFGQIHLGLVPKGLKQILAKALQQNPKARYQDIVDFITDITAYLESPSFAEETKSRDHINDWVEGVKRAYGVMGAQRPPEWPGIQLEIFTYSEGELDLPFYNFHAYAENHYGVILGKCADEQPEALFVTAILHGMMAALLKSELPPAEFLSSLNQLMQKEGIKLKFSLLFLSIDSKKGELHFTCSGKRPLWIIHREEGDRIEKVVLDNPMLGEETTTGYHEITLPFDLKTTFALSLMDNPVELEAIIKKKQTKSNHSFTVITLENTGPNSS